jgi:hypothetical protein
MRFLQICTKLFVFAATFLMTETNDSGVRASIFKRLRSPGIYSEELIPPAYVAWLA